MEYDSTMIMIRSLMLPFDHDDDDLRSLIARTLKIAPDQLLSYRIKKRSLDARKGRPIRRVYSVVVEIREEQKAAELVKRSDKLAYHSEESYHTPVLSRGKNDSRPVVVGSGPSGIFAGLILAEAGLNPIILERGKEVRQRTRDVNNFWKGGPLDPESHVQFGEGGAGTFSDGKLRTRVKDRSHRTDKILGELVLAGAPEEILYENKSHVGTANLVKVVENLREKIKGLGGEFLFNTRVVDLLLENSCIKGLVVEDGREIQTDHVLLAIGHSSRDTFEMLHKRGVIMTPKPFSIGFRIEHSQKLIDRVQYGKHAGHPQLGAAEYQLSYKTSSGRSVYSFCMCPGGSVIASSSEPGGVVTNGMSQYSRNLKNANAAIVAEVFPRDFGGSVLGGFLFQRSWEEKAFKAGGGNYHAPIQLVTDFQRREISKEVRSVHPSYLPGVVFADLWQLLPGEISSAIAEALEYFENKIPGFSSDDAVLTGVETRTSSPLRIVRGQDFQSVSVQGLFPVGEGSGYSGGIMSSAIDGIRSAESLIVNHYTP